MQYSLPQTANIESWSKDAEILASHAGLDSSKWTLGLLPSLDNQELGQHIHKLAKQSDTPNPFFELPILSAASKYLSGQKVQYLYLSETTGGHEALKFFAPIIISKKGLLRSRVIQVWSHEYGPLGQPLAKADAAEEMLKAFITCICNAKHNTAKAIQFDYLPKSSPFMNALEHSPLMAGRLQSFAHFSRAGLKSVADHDYIGTHFSGKRKQRLRVARQRLESLGSITFTKAATTEAIKTDLEAFLAVEASGWKGRQKTALAMIPETAAFTREAVYNMALEDRCTIHSLILDEKTVSSLVMFEANGFYYPWKIAFNETYQKHSVGNLLVAEVTAELAAQLAFRGLDSLAAEDNKTTGRFWPDAQEFHSMIIGMGDSSTKLVSRLAADQESFRKAKTFAKKIIKG